MEGVPFTFVTEGIERAIEQAKATAVDKDVGVMDGVFDRLESADHDVDILTVWPNLGKEQAISLSLVFSDD